MNERLSIGQLRLLAELGYHPIPRTKGGWTISNPEVLADGTVRFRVSDATGRSLVKNGWARLSVDGQALLLTPSGYRLRRKIWWLFRTYGDGADGLAHNRGSRERDALLIEGLQERDRLTRLDALRAVHGARP